MATVIGGTGNDFRQCQILNEKSNYSCSSRVLGELEMIAWGARVKGPLGAPALETSAADGLGQFAPHLAPGEHLQARDNGSGMEFKSSFAGLIGCSADIKQGGLYSLISEALSCSMRTDH